MGPLTDLVLDEALAQCRQWRQEGRDLSVAVNVSPSVLVDADFPAQVECRLADHQVPGTALVLEMTEDLLLQDRDRVVAVLSRLRSRGVRIAVDDYGTGYSSLRYLKDLPVTELKLDRSFVASMTTDPRSAAIVHSTVGLTHALGLQLVAEGVEDATTLRVLRRAGCDLVQGYHVGRPVPAVELGRLVDIATALAGRP